MARLPRAQLAGWPHLLVQRVHDGQLLARDDQDRQRLLDCLRDAARVHRVAIHAYALAADRLWLLVTPSEPDGISLLMQALGRRYVALFNRRHAREGSLWSGRFRATLIDPQHALLDGMALIETLAVRQGRVAQADDDPWSSARHHLGRSSDPLLTVHPQFWTLGNTPFEREAAWRQRLQEGLPADRIQAIEQAVHTGWALMPADAAERLQATVGRRLSPRPRGRPRKPATDHSPSDSD